VPSPSRSPFNGANSLFTGAYSRYQFIHDG
jgi:hypothetical protein